MVQVPGDLNIQKPKKIDHQKPTYRTSALVFWVCRCFFGWFSATGAAVGVGVVRSCFLYIVLYDMFQDFDIFQRKTPPKSVEKPKKNTSKTKKPVETRRRFFCAFFFSG